MAFERKELPKEEPANSFWSILKWFWIILPTVYFFFILPDAVEQAGTAQLDSGIIVTTIYQFTNLALAGVLSWTPSIEQSRAGAADKILKIAAIQQLLIQNFFGLILTVLTWYNLPNKVAPEMIPQEERERKTLQPKTLYIILVVIIAVTILTLMLDLAAK